MAPLLRLMVSFGGLLTLALATPPGSHGGSGRYRGTRPNVVVLFADDWGWGDLGANDPATRETPHMDALAARGMRFTDAHAMSVCTPSRASLLTGRLGLRTGVVTNWWTDALYGLNRSETTLAEYLKQAGYDTAMLGKWHLGTQPGYHPSFRGFDEVLSVPYSVDMGCAQNWTADVFEPSFNLPPQPVCPVDVPGHPSASPAPSKPLPGLPLYNSTTNCSGQVSCNADIVQQPLDFSALSSNYAAFGSRFIARHGAGGDRAGTPFFLYAAFSHVHVPLFHAPQFAGKSPRNTTFGDTLLELDAEIGALVATLEAAGVANDTLLLLTGDNGPWVVKCDLAGSQGPFIGGYQKQLGGGSTGKLSTWEGGHREPGVAVWPGRIPAGVVSNATISTLDFVPTITALAGVDLDTDRVYDGVDLAPVLFDNAPSAREWLWHPNTKDGALDAARYGRYKAHFQTYGPPGCNEPQSQWVQHDPPLIFDLETDPGETTPLANPPDGLVATFKAALAAQLTNISSTYRSTADYSEGGWAHAPCCNPNNAACRCTD